MELKQKLIEYEKQYGECIQGSDGWLKLRKKHITSTDAAIICGKNPWETKYKLWREKLDLSPQKTRTKKMDDGLKLEPLAREWFIKETGIEVKPKVEFNDFLMASLDGYNHKERLVLEIKCGESAARQAEQEIIPDYYMCQIQHQLLTSGCDKALYLVFYEDTRKIIEVKRDEEFIGNYIELAKEFYDLMINKIQPELTNKDYIEKSDVQWMEACQEYSLAKEMMKQVELKEKKAKEKLIELSQNQPSQGYGIKTVKVARKGSIDYTLAPQLKGVDLEEFRKPTTEYWSIYMDKE